jgi:hypothetical protein
MPKLPKGRGVARPGHHSRLQAPGALLSVEEKRPMSLLLGFFHRTVAMGGRACFGQRTAHRGGVEVGAGSGGGR